MQSIFLKGTGIVYHGTQQTNHLAASEFVDCSTCGLDNSNNGASMSPV